jgi:hypothetical protein
VVSLPQLGSKRLRYGPIERLNGPPLSLQTRG